MKTKTAMIAAFAALLPATFTLAQNSGAPKKEPAKETAPSAKSGTAQPAPKEPEGAPTFPAPVQKKLYARNDLRGKQAPKFEVQKWLSSEPERSGKVVLIDFWATWCGPCVKLTPELVELQKKYKDDLVVIGVSDEAENTVRDFVKAKDITYSMALDPGKKMHGAVGIQGIPHVLIISSDGIVRWQGFPLSDEERLTDDIVKRIIDADKAARDKGNKKPASEKPKDKAPSQPAKK